MNTEFPDNVVIREDLSHRTRVFADRAAAGAVLAKMLGNRLSADAVITAIPAGGAPVGVVIAERLQLEFRLAVISKMTLPWNSEVGFGALAFDGTMELNGALIEEAGLSEAEVQSGIDATRAKIDARVRDLGAWADLTTLADRPVMLVDDGLASGFTMGVALRALAQHRAAVLDVAVPTAPVRTLHTLAAAASTIYCPNPRAGLRFAVADAYAEWHDVSSHELDELLEKLQ